MTKQEKLDWIVKYITEYGWQDIFMEEFVNAYIDECNPDKVDPRLWGAHKIPELGRYLAELYRKGVLDRFTVGLSYRCDGFPKWCYGYKITEKEIVSFSE